MDPEHWRLVRAVFDDAMEQPPSERRAFIARRCGDDEALRRDVEELLSAEGVANGVLERLGERLGSLADLLQEEPEPRAAPYRIIAEAGRGGMGVVYHAHDPRLKRDVALKFLPHFLGRDPGARARFIEEARAASALDHPGICTIHDIGSTEDGRLYIAMTWYGGGTLADRLRDGPLPVTDAIQIASDVAAALERAHQAGIVHRDIKPANIAFTRSGETRVLDFGVAALEEAGAADVAGTPRYMAPEQLQGGRVDRRVDIWALGVVVYEMISGRPAWQGDDRATVLGAITQTHARALDWSRIPPRLASVIARALAPDPADRPAAAEFAAELRRAVSARRRHVRARVLIIGGLFALTAATALLARWFTRAGSDANIDEAAVAVLPFRVSGDPSLAYLRDGMVDLIAATLTGEGGLRAVDPRTVHNAWLRMTSTESDLEPDSARVLARNVRAGRVLLGEIVGTPDRIVVNTILFDLRGRAVARAGVQGPAASLTALVDTLAAQLLSLSAGVEPQRVAALTTTSLPALRAYLEGQASYRRGHYQDAIRQYVRALELDSTFALAGLGIELAGGWVGGVEDVRELGRARAFRYRERLSPPDRALLAAAIGPEYPQRSTTRSTLAAIEAALRLAPDRVELWYMQADTYLHHGRAIGVADWEERAVAGFRRAIELDSTHAQSMHHLVLLYARSRQLELMDAAARAQLTREPTGSTADFIRWLLTAARAQRSTLPAPLDSLEGDVLGWMIMLGQDDGIDTSLGMRAALERARRAGTGSERFERNLALHAVALNAGRPQEALASTERLREDQPDPAFLLRLRILDALYSDGDTAGAARAAVQLERALAARAPAPARGEAERMNRCVLDQWRITRGAPVDVPPRPAADDAASSAVVVCELAAQALHEAAVLRVAGPAVTRLDSMLVEGPYDLPLSDGSIEYANSALARAFELADDDARALTAIGRRVYFLGWQSGVAASLREETRLALLRGDTARAARAATHYLALRHDPEPALRPEVDAMRAQHARLVR